MTVLLVDEDDQDIFKEAVSTMIPVSVCMKARDGEERSVSKIPFITQ